MSYFPELKNSKIKITAEEFTGIVHLIEREWGKHYQYGISALNRKEALPLINKSYKFPSANISVKKRGEWKEKEEVLINYNLDTELYNGYRRQHVVQDNTYVAQPYLQDFDFDDIDLTTVNPNTNLNRNDDDRTRDERSSTSGITYTPGNYKIELQQQYIAKQDNTYVSPQYLGVYRAHDNLARYYATQSIREAIKKKYGASFKFVDTLIAAVRSEDGYWSVVKEIVKPCFTKAKTLKNPSNVKSRLPYSQKDFIKTVESILDNKKPVAIEYCSEMLSSGKAHSGITSEKCGMHLSVIVGYRLVNGVHQSLIQNSWGKSCGSYTKDWDCYKNQGAVWVNTKTLRDSSYRLVWM